MKNIMKKAMIAGAMIAASSVAVAGPSINVGGVVWDPDSITAFPLLTDFTSNGGLIETASTGVGSTVTGRGIFDRINSGSFNAPTFCPGCELTYTFSMVTDSISPIMFTSHNPNEFDFTFRDLVVNVYVDNTPDYIGTAASAADGVLWLQMNGNGLLSGNGQNIGDGSNSDQGNGQGLLDVVGGLAFGNFDTNGEANGSDLVFTSSFQPILDGSGAPTGELFGTFDMKGASIPEPGALALMGIGLLGFGASAMRRRKVSA